MFSERARQEGGVVVGKRLSFADKVSLMHGDAKLDLKTLVKKNLVFDNSPVNATMLRCILSWRSAFQENTAPCSSKLIVSMFAM